MKYCGNTRKRSGGDEGGNYYCHGNKGERRDVGQDDVEEGEMSESEKCRVETPETPTRAGNDEKPDPPRISREPSRTFKSIISPLGGIGKKLSELKKRSSDAMDRAFSRHALLVYHHAWHFIVISTLLTAIMSLGIVFRKHENDMYKLYSYSGAPSNAVKTQLLKHFAPVRTTYIVAFSREDHITPESLQGLSDIDQKVRNLTVVRDDVTVDEFGDPLARQRDFNPQTFPKLITFQDLCARDSWGDCNVISVLDLYTSPRVWGRPIVSREWPVVVNVRTKKAYRADAMLGNMTVVEKPQGNGFVHIIRNATAFGIRYDFVGEHGWQHYSAAFEKSIEQLVENSEIPGMRLSLKTERSISDELSRSSEMGEWEMILLTLAVFAVLFYTVIVNTTFSYRTKSLPGLMGVASTLMGYAGGAGFIYFCGLHHTPPAEATPFLVLGIGVDNAFVLINSYSLTFLIPDPKERIRHTTRDAGLSITCTTMTSVMALIIGAASPYESIAMFCIITAFCLFWGYVMSLTFFLGWLVLDCRREVAHVKRKTLARKDAEREEGSISDDEGEMTKGEFHREEEGYTKENLPLEDDEDSDNHVLLKKRTTAKSPQSIPWESKGYEDVLLALELDGKKEEKQTKHLSQVEADGRKQKDGHEPSGVSFIPQSKEGHTLGAAFKDCHPRFQVDKRKHTSSLHLKDKDIRNDDSVSSVSHTPFLQTRFQDGRRTQHGEDEGEEGRGQLSVDAGKREKHPEEEQSLQNFSASLALKKNGDYDQVLSPDFTPNFRPPSSSSSCSSTVGPASEISFKENPADQAALLERFRKMSTFGLVSLMVFRTDHQQALKKVKKKRAATQKRKNGPTSGSPEPERMARFNRRDESLWPENSKSDKIKMMWRRIQRAFCWRSQGVETQATTLLAESDVVPRETKVDKTLEFPTPLTRGSSLHPGDEMNEHEREPVEVDSDPDQVIRGAVQVLLPDPSMPPDPSGNWAETASANGGGRCQGEKYITINDDELEEFLDRHVKEPKGNVGRLGRAFLTTYYCRWLASGWIQALITVGFALVCGISIYGFTLIEPGITVDEICPKDSYLRVFFDVRSTYFSTLGEEITVFFADPERWESKAVQDKLIDVHESIYLSHHAVAVHNGMYEFLKYKQNELVDGDKSVFTKTMPHMENTSVLYGWLEETRTILNEARDFFHGQAFTPLAILWESDPQILGCTISNLFYALVAIVLMTVLLIPNFLSMVIVAVTVFFVDMALFGFMAIWGLRLNMLTMVILLLAIGYSVDSTTHVLNAFTHCCGQTRRDRMKETMVLMGNAIANGMFSTLLAVFFLMGSDKFVLAVFFKMMILVLTFSFGFGFIFLPVVLLYAGPMPTNESIVQFVDTRAVKKTSRASLRALANRTGGAINTRRPSGTPGGFASSRLSSLIDRRLYNRRSGNPESPSPDRNQEYPNCRFDRGEEANTGNADCSPHAHRSASAPPATVNAALRG
ncbi:putative patched transmembrane domain-containing protein [Neospora caninum Liverpool]|uniref:Putative patched transmembrane domain-containing protein n=1 Tax=Neospora caninum (strain Liverpool) TaxID=572307 RepID=F0VA19_NEOCL|nr:putative patched transmembrane domain-containing protein [Neospora caninum Liverpool]CBZ50508.1 putative patched transmembrane domain-containing protein [Neospora caninum Liverpool]|eukprot:XP_003880541.1 putative patched transmembrane domain-containing protein [Neospora caninum Liverpool]